MAVDAHGRLVGHATGWYAVAFSREVKPGRRLRRRLLRHDLVIARAASGVAAVSVEHGAPLAVRERHGVIVAYAGAPGAAPAWELAPIEPAAEQLEWSAPAGRVWRIRTHPQEIIENTVDVAHFSSVHHYEAIDITAPMRAAGPHLTMSYTVTRDRGLFGRLDRRRLRFRLDITASGVGYSRVQVDGMGLRARTVVMPTPVDDELTEVRVITQVALWPAREHPVARFVPRRWIADLVGQIAASEMGRDFAADIRIWETKRYQDPPRLVAGDGPIGPYRRWCRQFYAPPQSASGASAS